METLDVITAAEPQAAIAASSVKSFAVDIASNENAVEPLDVIDRPKVRTALRLYAILSALYVNYSTRCYCLKTIQLTMHFSSAYSSLPSTKQLLQ
jgi:hypothetical protein